MPTKTQETSSGEDIWDHPSRLAIATALLDVSRPLTPGELARRTRRDQSNVRRSADQMAEAGVLVRHDLVRAAGRAGRPPRVAYSLAEQARATLESHLDEVASPGLLRKDQQLVFAAIDGSQQLRTEEALAEFGVELALDWSVVLDGRRQEQVFVFDGEDALSRAKRMISALSAIGVDCHRSPVTEVTNGREAVAEANESLGIASEATGRQANRHASW